MPYYYHSSERPENVERLRAQVRGESYRPAQRKRSPVPLDYKAAGRMFTVFDGNRWMDLGDRQPAAKMLFGEFWYQHELCFLFANTNTGKSVLAVQIGAAIARGSKTGTFPCEAPAATVLYVDFELSNLQFHRRYSQNGRNYQFPANFYRAQANPGYSPESGGVDMAETYSHDDLLMAGLESRIEQLKATVLIIDNISCLGGGTGNAAGALRIMSKLKAMQAEYKLSILVLAHTPKRSKGSQPLSTDDLHGSKLLMNFADSAFIIGTSNSDNSLRYLKQVKQRSSQQAYGEDNVCLCRIHRYRNFLKFRFEGHSAEAPHLLSRVQARREQLTAQVAKFSAEGLTQREISERLNIALGVVNKVLRVEG
jgi:hypothetical protein